MTDGSCNSQVPDDAWAKLCRHVARDVSDECFDADTGDDIAAVRESLVRHRVAAAAERQAHRARAVVVDILHDPDTKNSRMIVATPTGDRREEREALIEAVAALRMVDAGAARSLEHARLVAFLLPWLLEG